MECLTKVVLHVVFNQMVLSVVFQVFWQHTHFVTLVDVADVFLDQKLDDLVTEFEVRDRESVMAWVVALLVFVSSALPVVPNVFRVKYFVLLNWWVKVSSCVFCLLS